MQYQKRKLKTLNSTVQFCPRIMIRCRQPHCATSMKVLLRGIPSLAAVRYSSSTAIEPATTLEASNSAASQAGSRSILPTISPRDLTSKHVSKVYCLPKEDVKQVFPHGLSRKFANLVDTVGRGCWVLRSQSYDIMTQLKLLTPNTASKARYLLHGRDGCGKSICLSQVIHWCVKSGWVVVHIPSVFSWTHSKEEVRSSTKHPGTYDQPKEAASWLKNFKATNSGFINAMSLSTSHSWTKRESSKKGDPLSKVIEQALLKPNVATEVVRVVLEEITKTAGRHKLLLAVDEFNGCFNPTSIKPSKMDGWLLPDQLNLIRAVTELTAPGKFPGAVVLALSRTKMYRHHVDSCKPEHLLGSGGMKHIKGYKLCEVSSYKREEMDNCVQYYAQEKWMNKALTPEVKGELWHLSSGNPAELYRLCSSL